MRAGAQHQVPRHARHLASLDGIRGLAIAAVVAFHAGYPWARAGFLGVSVFFTLSGYLITSLLVDETRRRGRVDLGGFYRRRAARLLPAASLGLVLALAVGRATGAAGPALRGDLLGAAGQVANWRWIVDGRSYDDLFQTPSPVLHYWSLAVEEQFYLLFPPLVVWALHRSVGRLRRTIAVGLAGSWLLLVALVVAGLPDWAYYATPARLGEVLAGALLGTVATPGQLGGWVGRRGRWLGLPSLGCLAAAVALVDPAWRWTEAVWLPVTAVLTLALIVAAAAPGLTARLLSWRPLTSLGVVSYGVYVAHWPLFLWLTPVRTGLTGLPLLGVRLGATLGLAVASHRLVEQPVRRWARAERRPLRLFGGRLAVGLAGWGAMVAVLVVGTAGVHPLGDLERVEASLAILPADEPSTAPPDPGAPRVAYFGDSTAAVLSLSLSRWGGDRDPVSVVGWVVPLGCGLDLPGERRVGSTVDSIDPACHGQQDRWAQVLAEKGASVAVVQTGVWEAADHRFPDESVWRRLGDPVLDAAYREHFLGTVDALVAAGARQVVWLTSPAIDFTRRDVNGATVPQSDPSRTRRYNELVREVASVRPQVVVLDLGRLIDGWGTEADLVRRPDGIHLTEVAAREVVAGWLGPALLDAVRVTHPPGSPASVGP